MHRPPLIWLSNYKFKAKIVSMSFIFHQMSPYEDIFMSTDGTKGEQARHKLLVEQLNLEELEGKLISFVGIALSLGPNPKDKDNKLSSRNLQVVHWK